jgi:hypothetical protein
VPVASKSFPQHIPQPLLGVGARAFFVLCIPKGRGQKLQYINIMIKNVEKFYGRARGYHPRTNVQGN